jgi:PQQ-dependent dehydrogenase (methanol/ethanol family)
MRIRPLTIPPNRLLTRAARTLSHDREGVVSGIWRQFFLFSLAFAAFAQTPSSAPPNPVEAGRARFNVRCAGCHGQDGLGGERAPAIGRAWRSRTESEGTLRDTILHGIPDVGMPAFDVPAEELQQLVAFLQSRVLPLAKTAISGDARSGETLFFGKGRCAECHMVWGRGSVNGPDLTEAAGKLTLAEVETALRKPGTRRADGYRVAKIHLVKGGDVRGFVRNESSQDIQLQGFDGRLHLLWKSELASIDREAGSYMPAWNGSPAETRDLIAFLAHAPEWKPDSSAKPIDEIPGGVAWHDIVDPKPGEWPTYHGQVNGNRYTELTQITPSNVRNLAPKWIYSMGSGHSLELTPVVVDGVMYVTKVNSAYALDARTGREIWHYIRPQSKNLTGDAGGGINRGVAVLGDRVFIVTDNAHLLALHRLNGALLWDVEMANSHQHYGSTAAPLIVDDLVIAGVSGGDEGIRGQLNAFRADTGERAWRFWSIPAPGDPEASTWIGRALEHGCGATWLTGTYDRETDTLIWPIGNPCPDFNGDERKGDNLYTDSVIALDPKSGKLKWHYQFTPHDLHDWDATETPMLVDMNYKGEPRKLLLQANRNGFFYVLDRTNGKFIYASPFVKKLTWAKGIGSDGRPVLSDGWQPTVEGTEICPSMDGASNWMSTAYNPGIGLFYLLALEKCNIFSKNSEWWKQGESFYGGSARPVASEEPHKYLRAMDPQTGKIAWEYEQAGPGEAWGGLLATANGLIFFGDDDGAFTALDAKNGKQLWHMPLSARWHASPMTYTVDGRQYIAVAVNSSIIAFGLIE